jgi:3-methylcrotonyl-CoA carboxylase alpha subunit
MTREIKKILIANRGEIACRIMDTAHELGIETVALYSDADENARHTLMADDAIYIGAAPASESYLRGDAIIEAAKKVGADAIHPGYGFLSENANFAEACAKADIIFIGPKADSIRAMGLKGAAKTLMIEAGVPVVPGYHGDDQSIEVLKAEADKIGYPLLIKAIAGGGGKGMRLVEGANEFEDALSGAKREGANSFGNDIVLLEKYITTPRHIEIQVFGDSFGNAVHLFERDCSLQRRHQKVVEEAPAPNMPENVRKAMGDAAVRAAKAIKYEGAGTIEFIVDAAINKSGELSEDSFYFMEMNTRLQVEHPVTELITGVDLVAWQIGVASGKPLPKTQDQLTITGHALEVRLYAEDPANGFLPQTGVVKFFHVPMGFNVRLETGIETGDEVSPYYDPMIAKIITSGNTRDEAIANMEKALGQTGLVGVKTNLAFLKRTISHKAFKAAEVETGFIEKHKAELIPNTTARSALTRPLSLAVLAHVIDRGDAMASKYGTMDEPYSPWALGNGWRMALPYVENLALTIDGQEDFNCRIHLGDAIGVEIDGESNIVDGVLYDDGTLEASLNGEGEQCLVWQDKAQIAVMIGGETFNFTLKTGEQAGDDEGNALGAVLSPMPGKIIECFVENGQTVNEGEPLLILEAMKMEYTLKAPLKGVVDGLTSKVNDQVADGATLLNITNPSS